MRSAQPSGASSRGQTYDVSCETSTCRRWPEWAINTCVAISRHVLSRAGRTWSRECREGKEKARLTDVAGEVFTAPDAYLEVDRYHREEGFQT